MPAGKSAAPLDVGPIDAPVESLAPPERPVSPVVCWFQGRFQPLADARISVMTHGFLYGTGIFEGIRAYWNADQVTDTIRVTREAPSRDRSPRRAPHPSFG